MFDSNSPVGTVHFCVMSVENTAGGAVKIVRRCSTAAWLNFVTTWYVSFPYKLKLTGVVRLNSVWVINREETLVDLNSEVKTEVANRTRQSGIASTEVNCKDLWFYSVGRGKFRLEFHFRYH